MPLSKRINRENTGVFDESQQEVSETQEDDAHSDKDEVPSPAAAREMRRRERQHKLKPKEMTEEEMMDLALRLSEQEANVRAQRLQEEEEAVRRAIQDSMLNKSLSLLNDAPLCVSSRRKLVYSNGESQTETANNSTQEGKVQKPTGHKTRSRKRRRAEGSPLMEMPEMSQTQPSPSSSESVALNSPQSCDSTQIEDCDLPKSLVFPLSSSAQVQVSVHVARLDQNMLDSCATSGFVLCSQDSSVPTQNSLFHQHIHSPTFPKSPAFCSKNLISKSRNTHSQREILDLGGDMQPIPGSMLCKSPVFGQTDSKSAFKLETSEAIALEFSSQESSMSFCLEKDVSLIKSPVFLKTQCGLDGIEESRCKSPVFGTNKRTEKTCEDDGEDKNAVKKHNTYNLSEMEPTCDMTLHWSDEDEDTPVVSPSPVFPEERSVTQNDDQSVNENKKSARTQKHCRAAGPQARFASESPCFSGDSTAQATVHYYWGVPFCPRGLDPNDYTKVIVAQLEVYEKSLKQAQRSLLNKLSWGEPILPQLEKSPSPESNSPQIHLQTRCSRRRKVQLKEPETDEELEEVDKETQTSQRNEEVDGDKSAGEEEEKVTEEEQREEQAPLEDLNEDETQVDSDCEVCPETQLSDNDLTQELTLPSQRLIRSPEIETVQVDSPNVTEPEQAKHEEPMETGPESQAEPKEPVEPSHSKTADVDLGRCSCESKSREDHGPQRSESPDLDSDQAPGPEGPVQCPICQQAFPSDQIEMHAAFCDGDTAGGDRASPKLRRKRTKWGETDETNERNDHTDSGTGVAQEKCYICHRAIPIRDYSRHTERCLQRRAPRTAATGGLLSALDQSEHKKPEAGLSGSTAQPQEVIDLIDDEEDSVSLIRVSNSPIPSFTSISEAQDCLIDFRTQHRGKRPRPRPGIKPGTKRR